MLVSENPIITGAISVVALVLGLPAAFVAISFEKVDMPKIVLGTKEINAGPKEGTKTVTFELISGPNDAVFAAAYISVISSLILVVGLVLMRHVSRHNIWGWLAFFPALGNLLGQIACMAYVFIMHGKNPEAKKMEEVQYINGQYDTNGKLYTREAWACMMNKFYPAQESSWADKACSDFKTGRIMTAPLLVCSLLILGIAYWQIHLRGGFGWLFGRRQKIAESYKTKALMDLEARS